MIHPRQERDGHFVRMMTARCCLHVENDVARDAVSLPARPVVRQIVLL